MASEKGSFVGKMVVFATRKSSGEKPRFAGLFCWWGVFSCTLYRNGFGVGAEIW